MPDIAANKPAAGAPIESAWGGEVHDAIEALSAGGKIRIQTGEALVPYVVPSGTLNVTYPIPFSANPVVIGGVVTNSAQYYAEAQATTPTGFTLRVTHRDGGGSSSQVTCCWIAIGPA